MHVDRFHTPAAHYYLSAARRLAGRPLRGTQQAAAGEHDSGLEELPAVGHGSIAPWICLRLDAGLDVTLEHVLVVLLAGVFHNFPFRMEGPDTDAIPGLGVGLRIVDREHVVDVAHIPALEAFDCMQLVAMRGTDRVEPGFAIERDGVNHQRVSLPTADRVSEPGRVRVLGMRAPIDGRDVEPTVLLV